MVEQKDHTSDDHLRAGNMLTCALQAESVDIWSDAAIVWRVRLTDAELAVLGYSVLRAMEPDQATLVVEAVFDDPNLPSVPLMSAMDEAASWADWADYNSIKACTLAGYNRMCTADQSAFLDHVTARAA